MVRARAYFHEQYADEVLTRIAEEGVLHQTEALKSLEAHAPHIRPVDPSERLFKTAALISRLQTMLTALRIEPFSSAAKAGVASEEEIEDIDRELSVLEQRYSAATLRLRSPDATGATTDQSIDYLAKNQGIVELSNEYKARLLMWGRRLENTRTIEEAKSRCARTSKTLIIEGWIPRGRVNDFERAVNDAAEGYCLTSYTQPPYGEEPHSHEVRSLPPTKIRNPRIAYVYEKLVTGFGLPNYFEVDPTVFMIVSFPLIFGLMFGDIGHGLILLGLSLMLVVVNRSGFRAPELFEYLIKGSPLLVMCSIAAIFFGFLYGEAFGSGEYYHIVEDSLHGVLGFSIHEAVRSASNSLEEVLSTMVGFPVIIPFPFEPFERPMLLLLVALYVAIVQITLGLILGLVNQLRRGNYLEAIVGPGLWLWFYSSCSYLFLKYKSELLSVVFQRGDILGLYIALPAIVMVLARSALHGMDGFGHSLESLISSLSNSISYGRILALALTHGAFSRILLMFLELDGGGQAIVGGLMWAALTFLLIICFEGLLSFIQTLRLHWVEWFLKFYSGDGYEYKPVRLN
ncbi:hypothetical protein KEJ39_04825 [Candidatus Bathyarchaeota archaeon]|nr:hypothetical protein [Candidatus Bathyarchaeota archaeon]